MERLALPNLKENPFDLQVRKKLEEFIKYKTESGESKEEAVWSFVKEYAFTYFINSYPGKSQRSITNSYSRENTNGYR